ncbi:uncharacterized protein LOC18043214 isoform X2 [Citrus clementina]|uniref:uncharacterized protein LOC18043214 isoform X2 n=1 Tax=Citrus clementina TaxID=85681 RepID=UPI000CED30E2|nr:uncharacterized protein LOC18043214 isoform X2 [Citrus x clementina]
MEFKFREIDDRTTPYRSSPSPSSQSSSYLSDQALRGNYSMDPNFLNNPRHFYTIQREIEKQIIRHEIITHEIITAEVERRRLLEEEVRRELMIEREMAMYRAREMGLSIDDRFSMQLHTSYPLMHQSNNCWLEDRFPFPWNPSMGFGHNGLPPNFLPHFSNGPWSGLEVNKKDKLIMLKAATPPAGSGELPSTSSNKSKEWSCVLCQVSATTERDLDVHLQGKKHKAKEKLLRDLKMCINSTSKKATESRDSADQEMKPNVEDQSVKANKTVVGLDQKVEGGQPLQVKPNSNPCGSDQKTATLPAGSGELPSTNSNKPKEWSCALCQVSAPTERGLDEHLQGRKHKAKVAGLLRDTKRCSNSIPSTSKKSTESRDGVGQEMKTKIQEESVNQKVDGGLDEHPQGKKQKAKEEELLGAQKWIKKSTESRDSAGQEMKAKVEEESAKANRTVVGLDQKEEGCQAQQVKPYPNLCGSKQEAATLPAGSGELPLTSSKKPTDWSCALCQFSTTSKRDLDEHLQGRKHEAKEEGLPGDQKMCSNSTSRNSIENRDSAGEEIKATVEEESVKANKTVVGLDQKVEGGQDEHLQGKEHKAKEAKLIGAQTTSSSSTSKESGKTIRPESGFRPESAGQAIKAKVEEESVEAIKTVVGLDQKVEGGQTLQVKPKSNLCGTNQNAAAPPAGSGELPSTNSTKTEQWSCALCQVSATTQRGLDEHLQGRKHKAKVAELLRDKKMCNNSTSSTSKISTESRDGVGQEMKTKVQEESVKANKTVVGLNQKVEGGLDEHPQGKKQKAKEEELLGAQKWIKKSTESRDSAGQEMKTKVEEESFKANRERSRLASSRQEA